MLTSSNVDIKCRLCNGPLSHQFDLKIFQKYDVGYFECANCRSLQTESPYWLEEAYKNENLSSLDTGAAQRNIDNLAVCYSVAKLFGVRNAIDVGGGDGLLCRLLRDYGINCYVKDKYATPTYAQGFTEQDFDTPDMVIGFEVLEHFAEPRKDLEDVFGHGSRLLLLSTALYTSQKQNWWYLAPESGQHVFFYSKLALDLIARKHGYSLIISGGFILLVKECASALKMALARQVLDLRFRNMLKALIMTRPAYGVWKDHSFQVEKSRQARQP